MRNPPFRFLKPLWIAALAVAGLLLGTACSNDSDGGTSGPEPTPEDPLSNAQFSLSKERQKYIWDIEHLAFILIQDIVPVFRSVVQEGRVEPLLKLLAPGFTGRLFDVEGTVIHHAPVTLETWESGREQVKEVDGEVFVRELASVGKPFAAIESIKIHVTALTPEVDGELDGRWTSAWEVRVVGTQAGGARAEHALDLALEFSRLSEEAMSGAGWIESVSLTRARTTRTPRPLMEEITESTGINVEALSDNWKQSGPPYYPLTGGAALLDFDRDGRIDLLIHDTNGLFLYRGSGDGTFEDVTRAAGLSTAMGGPVRKALVADLDNNGFEDILLDIKKGGVNWTAAFENNGDGTFRMLTLKENTLFRYRLRHFGVADYDGDGLVDLYLAKAGKPAAPDRARRWIGDQTSNEGVLLKNLGGWRFKDVTEDAGLAGESVDTLAVVWLDLESDGDADLFLANHMGPNVLWENRGDGTFLKHPQLAEFGGFSMGATSGDLDGDGDPDLYLANMYSAAGARVIGNLRSTDYAEGVFELIQGFVNGNELYENRGPEGLAPIGTSAGVANSGWSYGPAVVDLDGDGRLDLYAPAGYQSVKRGDPDG